MRLSTHIPLVVDDFSSSMFSMPDEIVVLLSTFPNLDAARSAARTLVEEKLVACGNLIPGVESIYSWKGEIETSAEVMAIFKTTRDRCADVILRIRALHPYEVPEILQCSVEGGWPAYLQWVWDSVTPTPPR